MSAAVMSSNQHVQSQSLIPRTRGPNPPKNVKHKSSKPIINWLQRKLGGTVRARRPSASSSDARTSNSTYSGGRMSLREIHSSMPQGRAPALRNVDENGHVVIRQRPISNPISLNSIDNMSAVTGDDVDSNRRLSWVAGSMWGSRSNALEADEDASLRPLPPTSPPSPSPSHSSSSYTSDLRTFKSMSASTKPTTLLSIDLNPGVAHIAQVPPTPVSAYNTPGPSPIQRFPSHVRNTSSNSNALITFAAVQTASSPNSSRPSSLGPVPVVRAGTSALQAPAHTAHHPRNNPRPSSPPLDNASVLTLASSAFATPLHDRERERERVRGPGGLYQHSLTGLDTASHISHADSTSHYLLDGDPAEEPDASVRALRPRSARRDSWESEVSHWSAGASMALGPGGRSVRTAPSFRTGGQGTSAMEGDDGASMWTREETVEEMDENSRMGDKSLDGSLGLSPVTPLSSGGVSPDLDSKEAGGDSNDYDSQTVEDTSDDVATPGPAARTITLVPSLETMPSQVRPETPPLPSATPSKDTQTTPKKTRSKKVELDVDGEEIEKDDEAENSS